MSALRRHANVSSWRTSDSPAKPDGISMSAPKGAHYDNSANKATRLVEPRPDHRPKPPLKPKHIWAIRTRLRHDGRVRDLAMFNIAIDSKLRGCDLVESRVS